jgi:hypothetical protein
MVSAIYNPCPEALKVVPMAKTSGDSRPGVSGILFRRIQDSFTTQGSQDLGVARSTALTDDSLVREPAGSLLKPTHIPRVKWLPE